MWSVEDEKVLLKNSWAYPGMMGTVSEALGRRHSASECLKHFEDLTGIRTPVVPPPPPPPDRKNTRKEDKLCIFYCGGRGICLKKDGCDHSHRNMSVTLKGCCSSSGDNKMKKDLPNFFESNDQSCNHNGSKTNSSGGNPCHSESSHTKKASPNKVRFCGSCGKICRGYGFWISCNACDTWFHGRCVRITATESDHIQSYRCPSCSKDKRTNNTTNDHSCNPCHSESHTKKASPNKANLDVVPIPGACAVVPALSASGLKTDEFTFVGFLPKHSGTRKERLIVSSNETRTQLFYVPPHKLLQFLEETTPYFGESRQCVIAREITKLHEESWRGSIGEAKQKFLIRQPIGEITLLIEGKEETKAENPTESQLEEELKGLISDGHSLSTPCHSESHAKKASPNKVPFCGSCGKNFRGYGFWISCRTCDKWFHGRCVRITAEHIQFYRCPSCGRDKKTNDITNDQSANHNCSKSKSSGGNPKASDTIRHTHLHVAKRNEDSG